MIVTLHVSGQLSREIFPQSRIKPVTLGLQVCLKLMGYFMLCLSVCSKEEKLFIMYLWKSLDFDSYKKFWMFTEKEIKNGLPRVIILSASSALLITGFGITSFSIRKKNTDIYFHFGESLRRVIYLVYIIYNIVNGRWIVLLFLMIKGG